MVSTPSVYFTDRTPSITSGYSTELNVLDVDPKYIDANGSSWTFGLADSWVLPTDGTRVLTALILFLVTNSQL